LAHRIHGLVNNRNISIEDMRLILQGRRLNNPQIRTNEIPIPVIQAIGKSLREGTSLRATAKQLRVSYDTVENIERLLGIRSAFRMKQIDDAVDAVRSNKSIREFSRESGISRSRAQRILSHGRSILQELGEIK
jgi:transposase-like protein